MITHFGNILFQCPAPLMESRGEVWAVQINLPGWFSFLLYEVYVYTTEVNENFQNKKKTPWCRKTVVPMTPFGDKIIFSHPCPLWHTALKYFQTLSDMCFTYKI